MLIQQHVNQLSHGDWPRCKAVEVKGDLIVCALDYGRSYNLAEAYRLAPHARFIRIETDLDLTRFVGTYGPLCGPFEGIRAREYWSFQNWLREFVKLLDAFRHSRHAVADLRESLLKFLQADRGEWELTGFSEAAAQITVTGLISRQFGLPREPEAWIPQASVTVLRKAAIFSINASCSVSAGIQAGWSGGRPEISARFALDGLRGALKWMVWQDIFRQWPLMVCRECGTIFQRETDRERKYCSYECGHRVAARRWRRNELRKQRRSRRSRK